MLTSEPLSNNTYIIMVCVSNVTIIFIIKESKQVAVPQSRAKIYNPV